jgi:aspartate aminotransferase-like enzyme
VEAAGFRPLALHQAAAVVAFWVDGLDAGRLAEALRVDHGILVARGQQRLRAKILRVSPIGKGPGDVLDFARALAKVLGDMGGSFRPEAIQPELEAMLEETRIWESLR